MLKNKRASKVKNSNAIKIIPIVKSKKIVVFGEIDILLNERVGTLLTNKKAIKTVR